MRFYPRLGTVNAALISLYFIQVWGVDAIRALRSPFYGFEDHLHGVAAAYFRTLFDLHLNGLVRVSIALASVKLIVAVGFLAYLIDIARALVIRREPNRETLDIVLVLASAAVALWAWPAVASGDDGLIRLTATQLLLVSGAMIVLLVERHIDERASTAASEQGASVPPQSGLAAAANAMGRAA
jgi:hypothetical protein